MSSRETRLNDFTMKYQTHIHKTYWSRKIWPRIHTLGSTGNLRVVSPGSPRRLFGAERTHRAPQLCAPQRRPWQGGAYGYTEEDPTILGEYLASGLLAQALRKQEPHRRRERIDLGCLEHKRKHTLNQEPSFQKAGRYIGEKTHTNLYHLEIISSTSTKSLRRSP